MTDQQQLFCDSLIDELADKLDLDEGTIGQEQIREVVERRIESYDNERREQYIRALSESLPRLVSEVI